jgi:hypothetical protein
VRAGNDLVPSAETGGVEVNAAHDPFESTNWYEIDSSVSLKVPISQR